MRTLSIVLFLSLLFVLPEAKALADITSLSKVTFDTKGFRDPFKSQLPEKKIEEKVEIIPRPELEVIVSPPDITIQGIVWGGIFPQAIIDSQVIREGDVLAEPEPITILEIKPKEVVVLYRRKIFTLHP